MTPHIRHLWKISTIAATLCWLSAALAVPFGADAVDDLRQALRQPVRDPGNREELQFRRAALEKKIKALSPGDLRRALALQEWRDLDTDEAIVAVDRPVRDALVKRLSDAIRWVFKSGGTPAQLAAITEIAEMSTSNPPLRASGARSSLAPEFAPDLVRLMREGAPIVRAFAARALGRIQPDPALAAPALGKLLATGDVNERRAAAEGLAGMEHTLILLTKGRSASGPEVSREEIVQTAVHVVPIVGRHLDDPDVTVRRTCLDAVRLGATILYDMVLDVDGPTRAMLPPSGRKPSAEEQKEIDAYRRVIDDERTMLLPLARALTGAVPAVTRATGEELPSIRLLACQTLEEMGQARQRLVRKASSVPVYEEPKDGGAEGQARKPENKEVLQVIALTQKDKPTKGAVLTQDPLRDGLLVAMPVLAQRAISDPRQRVRLAAVDALETLGPDAAPVVPTLARALADPSLYVRWATARVLGKIGPVDTELTVPILARLLCDSDLDVELAAANALGLFGPAAAAAVPALAAAVGGGDTERRVAALHALQGIGPASASAVPAMTAVLSNSDPRVRRAACEALAPLGAAARSAIPALERTLEDIDAEVRKAAADAILAITAGK